MIKVKQLKKDYVTRIGAKVEALKGIDIEFPETGLIFILGASGSGKSTLLNLLGGLDNPTSGTISIDDVDISHFNKNQLDNYRNKYIGFIFQDFNIINDLTIKDNLLIGASLQNDESVDIPAILEKVGLPHFEERYPYELSGGQLQRVAVARALVKQSQVILADEPTGNLDSETGLEIMKFLQETARSHLVIVVSHNHELAEQFADRLISMRDGRIVSDTEKLALPKASEPCAHNFNRTSVLPFKYCFKMSMHNLGLKKFRTILTCLVMIVAFLGFSLSISFLQFENYDIVAKAMKTYDVDKFQLSRMSLRNDDIQLDYNDVISPFVLADIESKYDIAHMVDNRITAVEDLAKMGITLYDNYLPLDDDGYYISDFYLEKKYCDSANRNYINIYDESTDSSTKIKYSSLAISDVVGHKILLDNKQIKVLGIYKSNVELTSLSWNPTAAYADIPSNYLYLSDVFVEDISSINNEEYLANKAKAVAIAKSVQNIYGEYLHAYNATYEKIYSDVAMSSQLPDGTNFIALDDTALTLVSGAKLETDYALAPGEVYLTYQEYREMFNLTESELNYVKYDGYHSVASTELKKPLAHLGETITLKIGNTHVKDSYVVKDFVIKGVIFRDANEKINNGIIVMEKNQFFQYADYLTYHTILIKRSSLNNVRTFLAHMEHDYGLMGRMHYSHDIFSFQMQLLTYLNYIFLIVAAICLIIIVFLILTLINNSVNARKKENGILKALGMRDVDLKKIYVVESVIVSVITYIPVVISSFFIVKLLNTLSVSGINATLTLLYFKPINYLLFFLVLVGINLLMTFISLSWIFRKKPIEVIKNQL